MLRPHPQLVHHVPTSLPSSNGRWKKSKTKLNGKKPPAEEKDPYLELEYTKIRVVDFNLKELVVLPREIDLSQWLASNTTTFLNLINLQCSTISEFCTEDTCAELQDSLQHIMPVVCQDGSEDKVHCSTICRLCDECLSETGCRRFNVLPDRRWMIGGNI